MNAMPRFCLLIALSLFCVAPVHAENWPGWRGMRHDGTTTESGFPLQWSANENIAWKTAIPGSGHSSPIVWNDRVFVTSCLEKEQQRILYCIDRLSGKIAWQQVVVTAPLEKKHGLNSYASSTPATDGQHIYVSFFAKPRMVVICYTFDGKEVWRKSPGEFHSQHGFCAPPIG